MKNTKAKGAKLAILCLTAILVVSIGLICLSACNPDGGDDGSAELMSEIQCILDGTFGYCYANNLVASVQFIYDQMHDINHIGNIGFFFIAFADLDEWINPDNETTGHMANLEIYIFSDEQSITKWMDELKKESPEVWEEYKDSYFIKNNFFVSEREKGIYEKLISCTLPDENAYPEYKFVKDSLADNQNLSKAHIYGEFGFDEDKTLYIDYLNYCVANNTNVNKEYFCISKNSRETEENWEWALECYTVEASEIGTKYTDDSFSKVENDVLYSYTKQKAGFRYEETPDGYALTDYYYDDYAENVYIPAQYNGKPITDICGAFGCEMYEKPYTVHIPATIQNISGFSYFVGNIVLDANNPYFYITNGCLIERETKTLIHAFGNAVIPSDGSVLSIDDYAFSGNGYVTNVVIPNGVTSIGSHTFHHCNQLVSVTIPSSVTNVSSSLFNEWNKLEAIYCEAESKPDSWSDWWLYGGSYQSELEKLVVWGYNA